MIILDTNVLSEALKPTPSAKVLGWIGGRPVEEPAGRRRTALQRAIDQIFSEGFGGRILSFDSNAAAVFAKIAAARRRTGTTAPPG